MVPDSKLRLRYTLPLPRAPSPDHTQSGTVPMRLLPRRSTWCTVACLHMDLARTPRALWSCQCRYWMCPLSCLAATRLMIVDGIASRRPAHILLLLFTSWVSSVSKSPAPQYACATCKASSHATPMCLLGEKPCSARGTMAPQCSGSLESATVHCLEQGRDAMAASAHAAYDLAARECTLVEAVEMALHAADARVDAANAHRSTACACAATSEGDGDVDVNAATADATGHTTAAVAAAASQGSARAEFMACTAW
mmetsp:Transcript_43155/g.69429  ORF Transcript_43155/g.69429 Transcript_43155/m.69429 type:complete len:254 (+) Transcript_43155:2921-3682(+)